MTKDNSQSLIFAVKTKNSKNVKNVLQQKNIDINVKDNYGNTALMLACLDGSEEIVETLLMHSDIDINIKNGGISALDHVMEDDESIKEMLSQYKNCQQQLKAAYNQQNNSLKNNNNNNIAKYSQGSDTRNSMKVVINNCWAGLLPHLTFLLRYTDINIVEGGYSVTHRAFRNKDSDLFNRQLLNSIFLHPSIGTIVDHLRSNNNDATDANYILRAKDKHNKTTAEYLVEGLEIFRSFILLCDGYRRRNKKSNSELSLDCIGAILSPSGGFNEISSRRAIELASLSSKLPDYYTQNNNNIRPKANIVPQRASLLRANELYSFLSSRL